MWKKRSVVSYKYNDEVPVELHLVLSIASRADKRCVCLWVHLAMAFPRTCRRWYAQLV